VGLLQLGAVSAANSDAFSGQPYSSSETLAAFQFIPEGFAAFVPRGEVSTVYVNVSEAYTRFHMHPPPSAFYRMRR